MIAGWVTRRPRQTRFRLLNKPKKLRLSVLIPPGRAPRLVPGDSPRAKRTRSPRAPVPRQTPIGATRSRLIHYLAAFSDPARASERARIDYLLVPSDGGDEPLPDDADSPTNSA
jgi:hypothetical protein